MMSSTAIPSARAAKVTAMRWRSTGPGQRQHVVERGREPAVEQGAGAARQHQRLARPRPRPPCHLAGEFRDVGGVGTPAAHQVEDAVDHRFADRDGADQALGGAQLVAGHHLFRRRLVGAGGGDQHLALGAELGIDDVDLQQEAVELRLGQRVGAFLFERVLGRQHVEGKGQRVVAPGDRDPLLLHRLEQRGLGGAGWPG